MSDATVPAVVGAELPDLDAIEEKWLRLCGACDAGLSTSCVCAEGDPRNVIASLVDEVKRVRGLQSEEQRRELVDMAQRHLVEVIRLRVGLKRLATFAAAEQRTVLWFADALMDLHDESSASVPSDRVLVLPPPAHRAHPDDWPAAAEGIATRAIREALPDIAISAPNLIARRIMADLVASDLLAVPGESEQQWGVRYPGLHPEPVRVTDEDMARHTAEGEGRVLMCRTVTTGPWREVAA